MAARRQVNVNCAVAGLKQTGRCVNCAVTLAGQRVLVVIRGVADPEAERVEANAALPSDVRVVLADGTELFYRTGPRTAGLALGATFDDMHSTKRRSRILGASAGIYSGVPFAVLSPDGRPVDLVYDAPDDDVRACLVVTSRAEDAA